MRCVNCDYSKQLKEKKQTVLYKECGLNNVVLEGVSVAKCPQCHETYYSYGDVLKLHKLIALLIVGKSDALTGKELRFLRTYLGLSGEALAQKLNYKRESISRFENEKWQVPKVLDAAIRGMVLKEEHDRQYKKHDRLIEQRGKITLKQGHTGVWQLALV